eukprot:6201052-Pleurochrysis_carterae.AAC.6
MLTPPFSSNLRALIEASLPTVEVHRGTGQTIKIARQASDSNFLLMRQTPRNLMPAASSGAAGLRGSRGGQRSRAGRL